MPKSRWTAVTTASFDDISALTLMPAAVISLLMPTRGRPALAARFFESVSRTSTRLQEVEVVYYVDDDDKESHDLDVSGVDARCIIGPRTTMGEYNTRCLKAARGDIIVLVNDDIVIRTEGWDEKLRVMDAAFGDGIYLGYANDLFKGSRLCTFPILSKRTCDLLVDPFPSAYVGAFIDYHLLDIFKRLQKVGEDRVRYLEDVVFEHMHYRVGKADKDVTYARRGRFDDDPVFIGLIESRKRAAKRLMSAIAGEPLLEYKTEKPIRSRRSSVYSELIGMTRTLLFDRDLPFRWRVFLWYWYIGRLMAARGFLRPFIKVI